MQGLDEYQTQQSDVTLEALRGLISLIPHLSLHQFEKHYTTLTFRIKQFFENVCNNFEYICIYLLVFVQLHYIYICCFIKIF